MIAATYPTGLLVLFLLLAAALGASISWLLIGARGDERPVVASTTAERDAARRQVVRLQARIEALEDRQREQERGVIPDTVLLEQLGEETTRVLFTARDVANDIRAQAEQSAQRIVDDAERYAARVRRPAAAEASGASAADPPGSPRVRHRPTGT